MMGKKLFTEFPPVSDSEWREKIEADLKGKPYDRLYWRTGEGFSAPPYLREGDGSASDSGGDSLPGEPPFRRGNVFNALYPGWQIVQEVSVDDSEAAIARLEEAFASGVDACKLYSWSGQAKGADFLPVLKAVDFQYHPVHLSISDEPLAVLQGIYQQLNAAKMGSEILSGTLFCLGPDKGKVHSKALIDVCADSPHFRPLGIDLGWVDENGGTLSQQLAFALSRTVDFLSTLEADKKQILASLAFSFPTGSDFMLEVAKMRAFRMLFARMLEVMEIRDEKLQSPYIIAQGARWNKSRYDLHTNLLRATTECMSAAMGGAHAIVVSAFDKGVAPESVFSARLARNIQHLIKHEAFLDRVADPAGGAYYVEYLTDALAQSAWSLFQELEAGGGYQECLLSGKIDELLSTSALEKKAAIAKRKKVFVGVNKYPNTLEIKRPGDLGEMGDEGPAVFERLRFRTDTFSHKKGKRPLVFLLMTGDALMRNARAQFSRNLLGSGGFAIAQNEEPDNWQASLSQVENEKPQVVVLCGADQDYLPARLAEIRRSAPGALLLIAGKAREGLQADGYIYLGINAIELIEKLQSKLFSH